MLSRPPDGVKETMRSIACVFALWVLSGVPASAEAGGARQGIFSRQGIDIWTKIAGSTATATFASPDKRWKITTGGVDDDTLPFRVRGRFGTFDFATPDVVDAELVWSPDSLAAFFTGSDGGAVGTYHTHVIYRRAGHLTQVDLSPLIIKRFGHPVRCYEPEDPNVGGITWLGKDRLLVAAEIPPHSNCDAMGTFTAYEVDLRTLRIVKTYSQIEAKRRFWSALGSELREAQDGCDRRPRACEIPPLHGRTK